MGKTERIKELERTNESLQIENDFLEHRILELTGQITEMSTKTSISDTIKAYKEKIPKYGGDVCFDYWPLTDWFRLSCKKWDPGRYFQLCVGPIRIEFYEN